MLRVIRAHHCGSFNHQSSDRKFEMENGQQKPPNGVGAVLAGLLGGGDQSIKLITLAMIVVSGGSNFFATREVGRISDKEAQRAIQQLDNLDRRLDDTIERQKQMFELLKKLNDKKT
jgi:hypothetical protein